MNEQVKKSLTDLIDETLMELEELKKSRFSAAEIEIKGPGEGIDGKPSNGKLDAAKAEDEKDEEKEEKEEDKKDEAEKSDEDPADHPEVKRKLKGIMGKGENEKADEDAGHHKMDKAEDKKDDDKDEDEDKEEKKDKDAKGGEEHEKEERKAIGKLANLAGMKKSDEEISSLMKSYIDERVKPLEDKVSAMLDLLNKIADQPVAPKGATARTVPLMKSTEGDAQPLNKATVASQLFELKKSGTPVDSLDVTKADLGQDLEQIVKKYKLS